MIYHCLACHRTVDRECAEELPQGDEYCSHQWESEPPTDGCPHASFACECDVNRLPTKDGGPVERYCLDVRVRCADCGLPFRFIGLPAGLDLNGASVSINAEEGHFAIGPKGQVVSVMEGAPTGYSVRMTSERFTREELAEIGKLPLSLIEKLQRMLP